jgi:type IV pilus assembly protein PilM
MKLTIPFRRKSALVGITIDDTEIRFSEVRDLGGSLTMQHAARVPVETGCIEGGKIVNMEAVELQLVLAAKEMRLKKRKAVLAVPSSFVVIRKVNLPRVETHEVRSLLEIELETTVHLPFTRPYFDFVKMEKKEQSSKSQKNDVTDHAGGLEFEEDTYLVIAAPGDLIDQYVTLLKTIDIEVIAVDIEPLALYRLLSAVQPELKKNIMFVQLGLHSVNVSIFQGDQPEFLRNVPLDLTNYEITVEERSHTSSDILRYMDNRGMLSSFSNDLVRELERVISFYQFSLKNDGTRIETLFLTGQFPSMERMHALLRDRLSNLEVVMFPVQHISHAIADQAELHAYTAAMGLSLRG